MADVHANVTSELRENGVDGVGTDDVLVSRLDCLVVAAFSILLCVSVMLPLLAFVQPVVASLRWVSVLGVVAMAAHTAVLLSRRGSRQLALRWGGPIGGLVVGVPTWRCRSLGPTRSGYCS